MSIWTNRPLPPREIQVIGSLKRGFDYFLYFADLPISGAKIPESYHGLPVNYASETLTWEPVINIMGQSGVCKFLAIAATNTTGSDVQIGVRLVVNGAAAYTQDRINVPAFKQTAFVLIGKMFMQNDKPASISPGICSFDNVFQLNIYRQSAINLVCVRSIHLTA